MSQMSPAFTLTQTASGPVPADRFVTPSGALAGEGARPLGVAASDAAPGALFPVTVHGTAVVVSGAAVDANVAVSSDGEGRAVTATDGAVAGLSRQAATEAGQKIEVLLLPSAAAPEPAPDPEPPEGGGGGG